jgi:hypothetical protein
VEAGEGCGVVKSLPEDNGNRDNPFACQVLWCMMAFEKMGIRYVFLSPCGTPEPRSQDTWLDWINSPQYDPCLAQERLDDYAVALNFTGQWTGPAPLLYPYNDSPARSGRAMVV